MAIRILIVDEAAFVRDALKRSIRRFLKEVEIFDAINGHRALAVLRTNKINLIISDWELPEMSGSELLDWVRNETEAKTPFIVMSDSGDKNLVMGAIQNGANDFMAKPFTPDEVERKVVKQLSRIGYRPKNKNPATQNTGFGSIDVLTGGSAPAKPKAMKPREIKSAAGFGKPAAAPKAASKPKSGNFEGTAHLHFEGYSIKCDIKEMSLTTINGIIERPSDKEMPHIFSLCSTDVENSKGEPIGELKVYIHSLQACDPRPDASAIRISLRFVDNEPEAFENLSKAIARGR